VGKFICWISTGFQPFLPHKTWRRTIERELKENGFGTWAAAASAAEDRTAWRQRVYGPILHLKNG